MMIFTYSIVKNSGNHWATAVKNIRNTEFTEIQEGGGHLYGMWVPHFGLPLNEFILMHVWSNEGIENIKALVQGSLERISGVKSVYTRLYTPTVRPVSDKAPVEKGLYVHRWMKVKASDIDEAVALSDEAWVTFEDVFESNVMGLFSEKIENSEMGTLLLLSWYRDFAAWEESRNMDKDAGSWDNFLRRHEMTTENFAIATGLYPILKRKLKK